MELRDLPDDLSPIERVNERRSRIERELDIDLHKTSISNGQLGAADEKNCEQMFGAVPLPVGLAGPLKVKFSSNETGEIFIPLATTEGALVASVNRGAKALFASGVNISSTHIGITRSIALETKDTKRVMGLIRKHHAEWSAIAEATSQHLKIISYTVQASSGIVFLTIAADTGEAMGMNMITIAAQAVADFLEELTRARTVTVAGNVDSDKKPSLRTKKLGRGFRIRAEAVVTEKVIEGILKSDPSALLRTARAKLEVGSKLAKAIGKNLHAANIIAAVYLATGQDAAHVVEGSLTDTTVRAHKGGIKIAVDIPAILVGIRGGGTTLPAQKQCLDILLKQKSALAPRLQLAETIGAAVLAGELSLLAAQASNTLAKAHKKLARKG